MSEQVLISARYLHAVAHDEICSVDNYNFEMHLFTTQIAHELQEYMQFVCLFRNCHLLNFFVIYWFNFVFPVTYTFVS